VATLIEHIYAQRHTDQKAQLAAPLDPAQISEAFAATTADLQPRPARGPFLPPGRKPHADLLAERAHSTDRLLNTEHLQALMWAPPRHRVEGHPELDFHYLARELTPTSSVSRSERVWLTEESQRHISLDALLMNADDRTPVVAEIKVGGDANAEYGLVQALAAAAQLSTESQRRRLHTEYRDYLGAHPPRHLDIYVITARAPERGTRPQLAARAHQLARDLEERGALSQWVRRIRFLEADLWNSELSLRAVGLS